MDKLKFIPTQASYSVAHGSTTVATSFQSGRPRYRLDVVNPNDIVNVRWVFKPLEFQVFNAFYDTKIASGSLPFLIDLIINEASLAEYEAHIVPDTLQITEVIGNLTIVTAQLDVKRSPVDDEFNESLFMLYEEYGEGAQTILNLLDKLVNVDFPKAIPND